MAHKDTSTLYTPSKDKHAPRPGDAVQVPSNYAGFCEFIEIICNVAIIGMRSNPDHHKIYPSAYDKVLAMLSVWGVADIAKVEEARFMWPDDRVPKMKKSEWLHHDSIGLD